MRSISGSHCELHISILDGMVDDAIGCCDCSKEMLHLNRAATYLRDPREKEREVHKISGIVQSTLNIKILSKRNLHFHFSFRK